MIHNPIRISVYSSVPSGTLLFRTSVTGDCRFFCYRCDPRRPEHQPAESGIVLCWYHSWRGDSSYTWGGYWVGSHRRTSNIIIFCVEPTSKFYDYSVGCIHHRTCHWHVHPGSLVGVVRLVVTGKVGKVLISTFWVYFPQRGYGQSWQSKNSSGGLGR